MKFLDLRARERRLALQSASRLWLRWEQQNWLTYWGDKPTAEPGLYFVGAIVAPTGQFRQIGIGATRVAEAARRFLRDESGVSHPR